MSPTDETPHEITISATHLSEYYSPIPPPEVLKGYETLLPGAMDRILVLVERQTAHRQQLEAAALESEIWRARAGMILGGSVAFAAIFLGFALVMKGFRLEGSALSGATLVSLIAVFVHGTTQRRRELEFRAKVAAEAMNRQQTSQRR